MRSHKFGRWSTAFILLLLVVFAQFGFSPLAEAQSIAVGNNSFETPTTTTNINDPTGATWTFTNGGGRFAGIAKGSLVGGTGYDANQVAYVQSTSSISQSLSGFSIGATYAVTVGAGYRSGTPVDGVSVTVNGTSISTFTPSTANYLDFTATFVATSTSETIGFVGTTPATNEANLDNVRITQVATSTISVPNNSFEIPTTSTNINDPTGASWTFTNGGTRFAGIAKGSLIGGTGYDLNQVCYIQSTSSIAQSLTGFVPGCTYAVNLLAGLRSGNDVDPFDITLNGTAVNGVHISPTGTSYANNTYTFVANGTTATLGFVGTSSSTTSETNLDNVRVSLVTTPSTPSSLTATAGAGQIILNWTGSTGASSYAIYRGTTSGSEGTTTYASVPPGTTTYTDNSATPGTAFYYVVVAVNASGNSAFSNEASATANPLGSSATFLNVDSTTQGSWKGVYGSDGYNVVGDTSGTNPSYPAYATVTPGTLNSGIWSGSNLAANGLEKVAAGSIDRMAGVWFQTNWTVEVNVGTGTHQLSLYLVDFNNAGYAETITLKDKTTGTILDTRSASSFQNGVYYNWNVSGDVTIALSKITGWAVLNGIFFGSTAGPTAPSQPTISATSGNGSISLNWTASSGATGYKIYRSTTAGGEGTSAFASVGATTTWTDTNVTTGSIYYYKVVAFNTVGGSPASAETSATTPPTGLLATPGDSQIMLSWNAGCR